MTKIQGTRTTRTTTRTKEPRETLDMRGNPRTKMKTRAIPAHYQSRQAVPHLDHRPLRKLLPLGPFPIFSPRFGETNPPSNTLRKTKMQWKLKTVIAADVLREYYVAYQDTFDTMPDEMVIIEEDLTEHYRAMYDLGFV